MALGRNPAQACRLSHTILKIEAKPMTSKTHKDEFWQLVFALQDLHDAGCRVSLAALNQDLKGTPLAAQHRIRDALSSGGLLGD
jgi:hypothetical protein